MEGTAPTPAKGRLALFAGANLVGPAAIGYILWLRSEGLIAATSLWIVFGLIVVSSVLDAIARSWYRRAPGFRPAVHARFACAALTTAAVIYAAGWGSVLVVAYLLGAIQCMAQIRYHAWQLVLGWCAAAVVLGEIGTHLGWLPSQVPVALGHAVAIFGLFCLAIVLWIVAETMQARDDAEDQLRQREERLGIVASTDPLTGLANRAAFTDVIEEAAAHQRRVILALADLDGFKDINDTHGHEAGDQVLREVAQALLGATRAGDTVARLGGDEFVILIDATDSDVDHEVIAARIEARLRDASDRSPYTLSASIGVVEGAAGAWEPAALLRAADEAMYSIKRTSSDRHAQRVALARSEARHRSILELAADAIITVDQHGVISQFNRGAERIFGASRDEMVGRSWHTLVPDDVTSDVMHREQAASSNGYFETFAEHADGYRFPVEATFAPLPGSAEFVSIVRDITVSRAVEAQLRLAAHHDELTGLPNRRALLERAESLVIGADSAPISLVCIDLDHFRGVNETLGHDCGDLLLREIGMRLASVTRDGDMVARVGGDEFAALCADLGPDPEAGAVRFAERLLAALGRAFHVRGHEHFVHAYAGVSVSRPGVETAIDLLRSADTAMYRAKHERHRRFVVFDEAMQVEASARVHTESALRAGIEREELVLHYQPIYRIDTGAIDHVEALVRWNRPGHGLVPPNEFVPIAEETDLVIALGDWVLRRALRDLRALHAVTPGVGVAVNVSARQLDDRYVEVVRAELMAAGVAADLLRLEITESLARQATSPTIVADLRAMGVRLELDDFGTGFNSLLDVASLDVDTIKIDRSFVEQVHTIPGAVMIDAILRVAASRDLEVVAEGVEHAEQEAALARLGCRLAQGYHFARPMPLDQLVPFVAASVRSAARAVPLRRAS